MLTPAPQMRTHLRWHRFGRARCYCYYTLDDTVFVTFGFTFRKGSKKTHAKKEGGCTLWTSPGMPHQHQYWLNPLFLDKVCLLLKDFQHFKQWYGKLHSRTFSQRQLRISNKEKFSAHCVPTNMEHIFSLWRWHEASCPQIRWKKVVFITWKGDMVPRGVL